MNIRLLLLFCFFAGALSAAPPRKVGNRLYFTPACPIIAETFNTSYDVNGATSDPSSVGWYLDASKVPGAVYFSIKSHRIKAQTLGGEGVWYSQVFDISGYTGIQVDAKISSEGTLTSSEYVKVSYILDGGPETLIATYTGNFGTPLVTSPQMTGKKVQIVIRLKNTTAGNSDYYIEQYDVFKEAGPCTVTSIPVTITPSSSLGLTCNNTSLILSAGTTATGTTTYSWSGPNGFSSSSQSVTVSTAGTYTVTGTNSAGTGTATYTVVANNSAPDVTATGAALACGTSATISAGSSVAGAVFGWTGPNGFTSASASPTVNTPGAYTVTVTNPATGCTATQTVTVTTGAAAPAVFWLEDFTLANGTTSDNGATAWTSATSGTGTYSVQNNEFKTSFSGQTLGVWTSAVIDISRQTNTAFSVDLRSETASSGDFFENADYVSVYYKLDGGPAVLVYADSAGIGSSTTGTASTTVTSPVLNGHTLQIIINTDNSDPTERYYFDNVKLTGTPVLVNAVASAGGELTCSNSSVTLTGSTIATGATFSWTGPGGFSSTVQNPTAGAAGIYTLTVTAGGCTATDTALVALDTVTPQQLTTTAVPVSMQLTCTSSNVVFTAGSSTPGVSYNWSGPGGPLSTSTTATATAAGVYTLTATNPANGCSASVSSTVTQNTTPPQGVTTTADPATAQITCTHPSVSLTGGSVTPGVTYGWSSSNGFSGTGQTVPVTAAGVYTVTVTDPTNGCTTLLSGTVTKNVNVPVGLAASASDIISCFTPTIDLQGSSTTPGASFSWTGPNGYTANTAIAETELPGAYTLLVTNPANGCSASTGTTVLADTVTPAGVTASNNGPLNCNTTSVTLSSSSTTPGVDFTWVTPDNNFIAGSSAVVTAPGIYTIVVTNDGNGCSSQATTTVIRNNTGCSGSNAFSSGSTASRMAVLTDALVDSVTGFAYKAYPNPFRSTVSVEFVAPESTAVSVELYSLSGYKERILFNGRANANQDYKVTVGAAALSSGTHFCIIRTADKVYSIKLLLVK
ncbi:MAG TPA: T9SS type A sorting domain-containing protein [Puia sp.]|uniref:T9SS type A sorting domain-containing protein n=1 Tax=Puia sp. TaxID=2045100 RepID=UPI002D15D851|nr:T9SS type A sorting domain-containing protein [Puia sp.]HVU99604.1 T9SS type A sorting domain-containing protein [Puia sp.]